MIMNLNFQEYSEKFQIYLSKNTYQNMLTYDLSNQVLASISTHSTFGPENLAKGNKTAIFNNKKM